jgi:hypothetical protein
MRPGPRNPIIVFVDERDQIRRWIEAWDVAATRLEEIRRRELETLDPVKTLALLEEAFNDAIARNPPRPSSGLVEMQRLFAKLRQ